MTVKDLETIFDLTDAVNGYVHRKGSEFFGATTAVSDAAKLLDEINGAGEYKVKNGKRQPMNKTANNPMEEEPSALAMRKFGQKAFHKISIESVFPKIIGVFQASQQGAGTSAFNFSNLPTFKGDQQLVDVIGKLALGGASIAPNSSMIGGVLALTKNIANLAGGNTDMHSLIDMSRPDHMIPFMNAAASAMGGQTETGKLFSNDVFAQGYQLAGAVQKELIQTSGGSYTYSKILAKVAEGDVAKATEALRALHASTPLATVDKVLQALDAAGLANSVKDVQVILSNVDIPTKTEILNISAALQGVGNLSGLGDVSKVQALIPQIAKLPDIVQGISNAQSIGQVVGLASQLKSVIPAISQLQKMDGVIGALSNFGDPSKLAGAMQNLSNLPKAAENAINSLSLNPQQMAQKILGQAANQQMQILGHIITEAGKF